MANTFLIHTNSGEIRRAKSMKYDLSDNEPVQS